MEWLHNSVPIQPWAYGPLSVVIVIAAGAWLADWVTRELRNTYENCRLLMHAIRDGNTSDCSPAPNPDRRSGHDRGQKQTPVAIERQSGVDRRKARGARARPRRRWVP
jgi:hypothetical protein